MVADLSAGIQGSLRDDECRETQAKLQPSLENGPHLHQHLALEKISYPTFLNGLDFVKPATKVTYNKMKV
jgi:hypothetical protein